MVSIMFELMLMEYGDMLLWIIYFLKAMAEALERGLSMTLSLNFGFLLLKKHMLKSIMAMTALKQLYLESTI